MTYLFIGGHADGKWIAVPDNNSEIRIPYQTGGGGYDNDTYHPRRLAGGDGGLFTLYVLEGISGTDAMSWLIHGYRRGPQKAINA